MGMLLHSCVEVHEPIKLSFGEVSGLGPGTDVLGGGPVASRGSGGLVCPHLPNGFNGLFLNKNVFDTCMKS